MTAGISEPAQGRMADDLADVFGPAPAHRSPKPKLPSEAWHHPRKQFVRLNQWCREIRRLARGLSLPQGTPFRYLTLPGDELLDVRAVQHVCNGEGIPLRFVGFNSVGHDTPSQAELHLSQSEVLAMPNVDRFSVVLEDRLEAIANASTLAAARIRREGPFNAVNFDLCNSIAQWPFESPKSTMAALQVLLDIQFQSTKPWLLFLTTRVEPGSVAPENWERFRRAIESNLDLSEDFNAALAGLLGVGSGDLRGSLPSLCESQPGELLLKMFCSGFGKWALRVLATAAPSRHLTLLSAYYYRSGGNPNMLSLAFRCDTAPQPMVDPSAGSQPLAAPGSGLSEPAAAIALAKAIGLLVDLDGKLSADVGLRDSMIEKAGRLMKLARHDDGAYIAWARDLWAA